MHNLSIYILLFFSSILHLKIRDKFDRQNQQEGRVDRKRVATVKLIDTFDKQCNVQIIQKSGHSGEMRDWITW